MFRPGRHLPEEKRAADSPIVAAPPPKRAILPLVQHSGVPARPVVALHDRVRVGQVVAEAGGFFSASLHAPVSGEITGMGPHPHPDGFTVEAVVIESDGLDSAVEFDSRPIETLTAADIVQRVRAAGVVGLGGAAFPTHVKLSPPGDRRIATVILNGCECEPYLTADHRVMVEESGMVVGGLALVMKALGAAEGVIAVEDNKPEALARLSEAVRLFPGMRLVSVPSRYPQGFEKQLIRTVLLREVPSGRLPMDVGALVQNVQTAKAIHDAAIHGRPLTERVLTVAGGVKRPGNYRVRIGTPLSDLVDFCGGLEEDVRKVVCGGPMMGVTQAGLDAPVIKATSGVIALSARESGPNRPGRCIRCGRCVEACVMGLVPMMMGRLMEKGRPDALEDWSVFDCMECGRCAYECPARIPLLQHIKMGKAALRKKQAAPRKEPVA